MVENKLNIICPYCMSELCVCSFQFDNRMEEDKTIPPKSIRALHIFLCHASEDKPEVRRLYRSLKDDNFSPWLDEEELLPGQDWKLEILKAIKNSNIIIVCLSCKSVKKAGFVQKELKYALEIADMQPEGALYIIPVKLEDCEVPMSLRHLQWVNIFEGTGYKKMIRALRRRAEDLGLYI